MPSVRIAAIEAQPSTIPAAIAARRRSGAQRPPMAMAAPNATAIAGRVKTYGSMPIAPLWIDGWTIHSIATIAAAIATIRPRRSSQGARLKNSHQSTMPSPQTRLTSMRSAPASSITNGRPNQSSRYSATNITAGHSRSGRGAGV